MIRNVIENSDCAAFGCSHTWGTGVEAFETWPFLLKAKNFGVQGCSADYIVRTAPNLILNNHIKIVFVLWPDWTRFEYVIHNQYYNSLLTDKNRINFMKTHNDEWLLNNFNVQVSTFRNWCQDFKIKLIDLTLYDLVDYIDHADTWPLSKLGHHYGPEWHCDVANIFKNSLTNNIVHKLKYE